MNTSFQAIKNIFQCKGGPIALRVREADVPVVDDQECTVRINSVTEKLFILPASSFCAGGDEGNDACQGDGGSGLTCQSDGYYELTGLVSWGIPFRLLQTIIFFNTLILK